MQNRIVRVEYADQTIVVRGREVLASVHAFVVRASDEGEEDADFLYGPGTGTREATARRRAREFLHDVVAPKG